MDDRLSSCRSTLQSSGRMSQEMVSGTAQEKTAAYHLVCGRNILC